MRGRDRNVVDPAEPRWGVLATVVSRRADCDEGMARGVGGGLSSSTDSGHMIHCLTDSAKSPLDRIQRFWTYYIGRVLSQYAEDVKGRIFTHSINRLAKDDLESRILQL